MDTDLEELIRNTLERDARRAPTQLAQHSMSPVNRPWPRSRNWGYVLGAAAVTATVAIIGIGRAFDPSDQTTASAHNRSDGSALCREIVPKIGLNAELLRAGEFDS
jgi:hypothetical protein